MQVFHSLVIRFTLTRCFIWNVIIDVAQKVSHLLVNPIWFPIFPRNFEKRKLSRIMKGKQIVSLDMLGKEPIFWLERSISSIFANNFDLGGLFWYQTSLYMIFFFSKLISKMCRILLAVYRILLFRILVVFFSLFHHFFLNFD